jgi:hypothetical protein
MLNCLIWGKCDTSLLYDDAHILSTWWKSPCYWKQIPERLVTSSIVHESCTKFFFLGCVSIMLSVQCHCWIQNFWLCWYLLAAVCSYVQVSTNKWFGLGCFVKNKSLIWKAFMSYISFRILSWSWISNWVVVRRKVSIRVACIPFYSRIWWLAQSTWLVHFQQNSKNLLI